MYICIQLYSYLLYICIYMIYTYIYITSNPPPQGRLPTATTRRCGRKRRPRQTAATLAEFSMKFTTQILNF